MEAVQGEEQSDRTSDGKATRWSTGYGRSEKRCNTVTRVVIFGCLGMVLYGYDTGIVSGAMVLVKKDIALDTSHVEMVVSVTLFCAAISTVFGIAANSLLGRKPVIMSAAVLYICGSLVIALAEGYGGLVVGRALLGAAIGFASGTVPMYSAELSPPQLRGMVVTLNDLNIVGGQLCAALVNVLFRHVEGGWRWSMGLAAAPAALLLVGFMFLPESPRWLAMQDRRADAEAVLQLVYDRQDVSEQLQEILAAIQKEKEPLDRHSGLGALLARGARKIVAIWTKPEVRRAAVLGIGLMAMNQLSGINTVMYYSTTILLEAGFSRDASLWLAAICCAAQLAGVGVSVMSMDTLGRRKTALRSCVFVVVTLVTLSVAFWSGTGALWSDVKVAALMLYLVAFGSGLSGVPWVMNSEIYPLRLRSVAVGQATVFKWVLSWLVGRYFLSVCEGIGTGGAFSVFAGFSVLGGVWLFFMLPETMGLELEAISGLFADPYPKAWWRGAVASKELDGDSDSEDEATSCGRSHNDSVIQPSCVGRSSEPAADVRASL